MKKIYVPFVLLLLLNLFACNSGNKNQQNQNDSIKIDKNQEITNEQKKKNTSAKEIIIKGEKQLIDIKELKQGETVFDLKISELQFKGEKDFLFIIEEDFILEGNLNNDEEGITFTSDNNAFLKIGDMEKPFFMWTSFNNNDEFLNALSSEQKQKVKQFKEVSVKIHLKNYKVIADSEGMYIGASADFVNLVD